MRPRDWDNADIAWVTILATWFVCWLLALLVGALR